MKKIFSILSLLVLLGACSPYQKALKSQDNGVKYAMADSLYNKDKYGKAIRLFEQIAPAYRGKPQAEKLFYTYAQSYFKSKQYYLAAYQFESFASSYPKSEKAEECAYLGAMCYSKLSPSYSLDQVDTYKAIDKLQGFINAYPNSTYLAEANVIAKDLRDKIEKKSFEVAKQYNTISDYKSATVALDIFMAEFAGTPLKEDALYYKLDSAYKLAINSVQSKKEERLNNASEAYTKLIKFNGSTSYKSKADDMLVQINNDLKQFSK